MPGETLLVVEDNALNLELAAEVLAAAGYVVLQAKDAEEAIALARAEKPALILMDLSLPGIDGLRATGMLKKDLETREIPVIALTSRAMKGDEDKARAAGCEGYIAKPMNTRTLPRLVEQIIRQHEPNPSEPEPAPDRPRAGGG